MGSRDPKNSHHREQDVLGLDVSLPPIEDHKKAEKGGTLRSRRLNELPLATTRRGTGSRAPTDQPRTRLQRPKAGGPYGTPALRLECLVPALLGQIDRRVVSISADGAYDTEGVYQAAHEQGEGRAVSVRIPPGRNARLSQRPSAALTERNRNIRSIRRLGRREWPKRSGYSKRSMVENAIYRYTTIIGRGMRSRTLAGQRVEVQLACRVLNTMKPVSACPTATEWGDSLSGNVEPGLSPEPCNNASVALAGSTRQSDAS